MADIIKSPRLMAAREATGDGVVNDAGENLGKIEDFVIDLDNGRIAYAVLSFGGFLGRGNKYFAVPWEALKRSLHDKKFLLQVDKEVLKQAPGFDKDERPDFEDRKWATGVYTHYGYTPYWLGE
jgi:sporulation protein YlmC with PRC-barrel domain